MSGRARAANGPAGHDWSATITTLLAGILGDMGLDGALLVQAELDQLVAR